MNRAHALVVTLVVLAAAGGAIAMTTTHDRRAAADPRVELSGATAPLTISDSRSGRAVVRGTNMGPGEGRQGRVAVAVSAPAAVSLSAERIRSRPGLGGDPLASALQVRVTGARVAGRHRRDFFAGPLAALSNVGLGRWAADDRYHFRIVVSLPASPLAQDSLQGGTARFSLVWRAIG